MKSSSSDIMYSQTHSSHTSSQSSKNQFIIFISILIEPMWHIMGFDGADSSTHSVILMVMITIIIGALILACFLGFIQLPFHNCLAPAIIQIVGVNHNGEKLESQVVIRSFSHEEINNSHLMARIKVNDEYLLAFISTLDGNDFIPTNHYGVKTIGGSGCRGQFFAPKETIVIDLKNGFIHPGDNVELRIYRKLIGCHSPLAPGNLLDSEYMEKYEEEFIFSQMKDYRLFSQHWYNA